MIRDVIDMIAAALEAALGCTVVKGYPNWGRPSVTLPAAALEITAWTPNTPRRIGDGLAGQSLGLRLALFGRHEIEMAEMLETTVATLAGLAAMRIDSRPVYLKLEAGQRQFNQSGVQQEDHVFSLPMTAAW